MEPKEEYYKLVKVGKCCLAFIILGSLISAYVFKARQSSVGIVADLFGILGSVLAGLQYFPQIYTTLHLQHAGSLSIPMMCIQTPGGFAWSLSLASRNGVKWSSWMPYFTAAFLQLILLIIAVYFELRNRRLAKQLTQEAAIVDSEPTENTPLITA